jgi:hypothetical protein
MEMSASVFESLKTALVALEAVFAWKMFHRFWHLLAQSAPPSALDALDARPAPFSRAGDGHA